MTEPATVVDSASRSKPPAPRNLPVLHLEHLSVTFPRRTGDILAVRDVSLTVHRGSTVVILGESGSGKSVTLRTVLNMHPDGTKVGGAVRYEGTALETLSARQSSRIRGDRIGFVPQSPLHAFDPLRRIGPQISELLRVHGISHGRKQSRSRALELLTEVGLPDPKLAAAKYPHELSGGMCQRAAIAMAVACRPDLLLCDEPTTALDVTMQAQILDLFEALAAEHNMAMVLVTHDVDVAAELGGDVAVMYAGRVVESGPTAQVLANPGHPYLQGLLASRPTPGRARGELLPIAGSPPNPVDPDAGCALVPRCPKAFEACAAHRPELRQVSPGHRAACLLVPEGGALDAIARS